MRIFRFIRAWFYYSTFRNYLYSEGTKPAQTRFQYAKRHSWLNWTLTDERRCEKMKIIIGIIIYAFIGCVFAGFLEDDSVDEMDTLAQVALWPIILLIIIAWILSIIPLTIGRVLRAIFDFFNMKNWILIFLPAEICR